MSLTNEDLAAIKSVLQTAIREELEPVNRRLDNHEERFDNLDSRLLKVELHLENVTDDNIKLLAENHASLISKLNGTIKYPDDTTIYKVKVNYLVSEVEKLKQQMDDLRNRIA